MRNTGFTLIELSIVLVIIGLIVGGILVGQDLIKGAEVRAQLSQIEKYNSAVNTFRGKFGGLPGDLALAPANQFGFPIGVGCDGSQARRDGNGLIQGWPGPPANTMAQSYGETVFFWQDLSSAVGGNLIEGSYPNSGGAVSPCNGGPVYALTITAGTTYIGDYYPAGRIGHGTFINAYENSGYNWYALATVSGINTSGVVSATGTIPVMQAYSMDKKIDDGIPITGVVQAVFLNGPACCAASVLVPATSATTDSTTTCYSTTTNAYSLSSLANFGANGNCALSFRFQ